MAHTFTNMLAHGIFSTKNRAPLLDPEIKPRLFAYMGGIARELNCKPLVINGPSDHVHLLLVMSAKVSMAELMRVLKSNSTNWVHTLGKAHAEFAWQGGYTAFSVSQSNVEKVRRYIEDQEAHHRKLTFKEELVAFLKKHGITYDDRYLWD